MQSTSPSEDKTKQLPITKELLNEKRETALKSVNEMINEKPMFLSYAEFNSPPNALQYYVECLLILLNKRMVIARDFGDYVIRAMDGSKAPSYYPFSWEFYQCYVCQKGYGSFFDVLTEWKMKLEEKKFIINDEILELIKPLIDIKTVDGRKLFDQGVAKDMGGDCVCLITTLLKTIADYGIALKGLA